MKLVFATNNRHKLEEVRSMLSDRITVVGLEEIGCNEEIEETENTLEGNAKIKSDFISDRHHLDCFADDTGLEVEVLGGAPGVYSARYAGENASFEDNVDKLLSALEGQTNRKARFRTVISLKMDGKQYFFEGVCSGEITREASGEKGFGYDPVFRPAGSHQTFAEMSADQKNLISHRGLAVKKLVDFLNQMS
jgi:XTP/dITP diphosphohydrolase